MAGDVFPSKATMGMALERARGRAAEGGQGGENSQGFSRRNLFHMIRLADALEEERTVQTLSAQLSWSHFIEIIYLKDPQQRRFYAELARVERWSVRMLRRKIQGMLYERTAISRKPEELARQELEDLQDEDRLKPDQVFPRSLSAGLPGAGRHGSSLFSVGMTGSINPSGCQLFHPD